MSHRSSQDPPIDLATRSRLALELHLPRGRERPGEHDRGAMNRPGGLQTPPSRNVYPLTTAKSSAYLNLF